MTDRVHPSSKPNATSTTTVATTTVKNPKLPLPPAKSQPYNHNHRPYRRRPTNYHSKRRRCFCTCCFWSIVLTILLLLLATISGSVIYLLYRPHRPTFSVDSLKISRFNLTTASDGTTRLTSNLNLTISTTNPNNKNIVFHYDPIAIRCLTDETEIAKGYYRNSFASDPNNITIVRSSLSSDSLLLETESVNRIRSDLKRRSGLRLKVLLDTQAIVKVESFRSKKVGVRIKCEGIHSLIRKARGAKSNSSSSSSSVSARVSDARCEVDLRIKVWKWTF